MSNEKLSPLDRAKRIINNHQIAKRVELKAKNSFDTTESFVGGRSDLLILEQVRKKKLELGNLELSNLSKSCREYRLQIKKLKDEIRGLETANSTHQHNNPVSIREVGSRKSLEGPLVVAILQIKGHVLNNNGQQYQNEVHWKTLIPAGFNDIFSVIINSGHHPSIIFGVASFVGAVAKGALEVLEENGKITLPVLNAVLTFILLEKIVNSLDIVFKITQNDRRRYTHLLRYLRSRKAMLLKICVEGNYQMASQIKINFNADLSKNFGDYQLIIEEICSEAVSQNYGLNTTLAASLAKNLQLVQLFTSSLRELEQRLVAENLILTVL